MYTSTHHHLRYQHLYLQPTSFGSPFHLLLYSLGPLNSPMYLDLLLILLLLSFCLHVIGVNWVFGSEISCCKNYYKAHHQFMTSYDRDF